MDDEENRQVKKSYGNIRRPTSLTLFLCKLCASSPKSPTQQRPLVNDVAISSSSFPPFPPPPHLLTVAKVHKNKHKSALGGHTCVGAYPLADLSSKPGRAYSFGVLTLWMLFFRFCKAAFYTLLVSVSMSMSVRIYWVEHELLWHIWRVILWPWGLNHLVRGGHNKSVAFHTDIGNCYAKRLEAAKLESAWPTLSI